MADLRTEEEQVEAIKRWWKENGRTTILGVVLAITVVVGWQSWQHFKRTNAEQASLLYQNLISAAAVQPGQPMTEENRKTAEHLSGQLKEDFSNSIYSQYAALWLAKNAVDAADYKTAEAELEWVLAQEPEASMKSTVELRLARLLLEQGDNDAALAYVDTDAPSGFASSYLEVKGDILAAKGDLAAAHQAYNSALNAADSTQRPILEMKRDDFAAEGK